MGIQERDYMRGTGRGGYAGKPSGRARLGGLLALACVVVCATFAGLLMARMVLQQGWMNSGFLHRPGAWLLRQQPLELPALVAAMALLVACRATVVRRLLMVAVCVLAGVVGTAWANLTPQGRSALDSWLGEQSDRLFWRGTHGESLASGVHEGRATVVQPDGRPIHLINNKSARNPSWKELVAFLRKDRTDENAYVPGVFVCSSFAEMLHNNAEAAGYSCAFVTLDLGSQQGGHACNAFETTDRGLVFIDCTNSGEQHSGGNDGVVDVREGHDYTPRHVFPSDGWHYRSMGVARNIQIHW